MFEKESKAILEGLLFVADEPIELERLSKIIELSEQDTRDLLLQLKKEYQDTHRGFQLIENNGAFYLSTKPEHSAYIQKLLTNTSNKLSKAALETLAIVAYKQPITKSEVELIRGVKVDRALVTLLDKKLIKELGRKDGPGKPFLYGTTPEFLNYFGLSDISELPDITKFRTEEE